MLKDNFPAVRIAALKTLTSCIRYKLSKRFFDSCESLNAKLKLENNHSNFDFQGGETRAQFRRQRLPRVHPAEHRAPLPRQERDGQIGPGQTHRRGTVRIT